MNTTTPATPALAAGGNPKVQLRHLKAHRTFQNMESPKRLLAKIDHHTTITQKESRNHITRDLHAKINAKDTHNPEAAKLMTNEGQRTLRQLARMVQDNHAISPGDGHTLPWNLRLRMIRSTYPNHTAEETISAVNERQLGAIRPKEDTFPERFRNQVKHRQLLIKLLKQQHQSTRHHHNAVLMTVLTCPQCGQHQLPELNLNRLCPHCGQLLPARAQPRASLPQRQPSRKPPTYQDHTTTRPHDQPLTLLPKKINQQPPSYTSHLHTKRTTQPHDHQPRATRIHDRDQQGPRRQRVPRKTRLGSRLRRQTHSPNRRHPNHQPLPVTPRTHWGPPQWQVAG